MICAKFNWHGDVYYYPKYGKSPIIISKLPGFYISSHSQVANMMTVFTTMNEYDYLLQLLNRRYGIRKNHSSSNWTDPNDGQQYLFLNLLKNTLLIRMKNGTKQIDRTEIIDLLSTKLNKDFVMITDTKKTINDINKTAYLLSIFIKLIAILTMFLCFFISFISFRQNIFDNIYEFGVLKSIGINNINIMLIFIFESIIITLSSLLLGTIIGCTQSILITLQSQILTENIFVFTFPTKLYFILVILSLFIAIISSILPSIILIRSPPSNILRM